MTKEPRTAAQLATELLRCRRCVPGLDNLYSEAAAMLRAQAEEIERLRSEVKDLAK